jgi:DNA topoisomerase III
MAIFLLRNFFVISCQVNKDTRQLKPTDLGITLIHGYRAIDPDLVGPKMRADTEQQLDLVAQGKADYQTVSEFLLYVDLKFW